MAKDIKRHLSHLKSSGGTAPAAADLVYGEIAVGYKKDSEALYIKNNSGEVITFTSAAGGEAAAELYTDQRVISTVVGDTEISVSLNAIDTSTDSGRTLTITHAAGSAQSGFKKLSSDSYGHITGGSNVALSDLTGLGALSGVTGEQGISASTRASGNQKIGHTNIITAGTAKGSSGAIAHGGSIDIPSITYDANGHITASGKTTVTLPGNDNYITGVTASASGINASVTSGVLTVSHSNSITAGSAKTSSTSVTATPSGANIAIPVIEYDAQGHIKSTGSTNVSLKVNTAATNTAGVVKIATTTGTNNSDTVMTQSAVTKAIEDSFAAQDAMVYKGLVGSGTNYGFPTTFSKGATYKVATAFTADSVAYEIGDMFIANTDITTTENYTKAHWDAIQTNLDPTLYVNTARTISTASGLTGGGNLSANRTIGLVATGTSGTYTKVVTDVYGRVTSGSAVIDESDVTNLVSDLSKKVGTATTVTGASGLTGGGALSGNVTIGHATAFTATGQTSPNAAQTPAFGADFNVPVIKYDKYGHITGTTTTTVKIPASASSWTNNYYVTGATVSANTTDVKVTITGNNASVTATPIIPAATTSSAGTMSAADKTALNNLNPLSGKVSTLSAITASSTAINSLTGSVGTMAFKTAADYEKSLNVSGDTGSTAITYNAKTAKNLTIAGSANSGGTASNAISVVGESNKLVIHLNDIICGDYA